MYGIDSQFDCFVDILASIEQDPDNSPEAKPFLLRHHAGDPVGHGDTQSFHLYRRIAEQQQAESHMCV